MNRWSTWMVVLCAGMVGCGKPATTSRAPVSDSGSSSAGTHASSAETGVPAAEVLPKPKRKPLKPVELGESGSAGSAASEDSAERVESARAALRPLQILIGNWNGTPRKATIDQPNWAWDLKTDPRQPALRIKSEKGQYLRDGRLTFYPADQEFELTATDAEGKERTYRGNFSQEVQDIPGDDKKLQRTYKLQLTELQADAEGEQWRIVINQQENNRYILELDRKRGSGPFIRVDTVNTQRDGTSFALSDTDYGEKTCIISQGLGTTTVSYKGKTYWVCCSGCKAAFEDEPEKWIAKWEAMNKDKMAK